MMQSCASAAKLRSGGPILPIGMKAKGHVGSSATSNHHRLPSQVYGQGRNCRGSFSILHSLCRTQNDAVRYNALPHEPPQGDQKLARQVSIGVGSGPQIGIQKGPPGFAF